jgi:6-phosphogluconolactonase (cycloisomerase 2 family)
MATRLLALWAILGCTALSACGGGGGGGAPASNTIGGAVSGLAGSGLVLQNNGGNNTTISGNGAFTFSVEVPTGSAYSVTVLTQPTNPTQTCVVSNGSGQSGGSSANAVTVSCTTVDFSVGGSVSGLAGTGLVLTDNGGSNTTISGNGPFTFATAVASGATYNVSVSSQPSGPSQVCVVASGSGTVGGSNVTNIAVTCSTSSFTVGGNVSGLTGSGLVLQDNGGSNLAVTGNGPFTFATALASGSKYTVTVFAQPSSPIQTCTVSNGSGTVAGSAVTNVAITCNPNIYTVGGTVSGLTGTGLVLADNGGGSLAVSGNGPFAFATKLATSSTYDVTVPSQPTGPVQNCTVTSGAGTIASANVTTVFVSCVNVSRFAYLIGSAAADAPLGVWANTINPAGGAWTTAAGSPYATGTDPLSVAVDPASQFAYVVTATPAAVSAYSIDPSGGGLTAVTGGSVALTSPPTGGGPGGAAVAIAIDPLDRFAYVLTSGGVVAYTINSTTGVLTPLAGGPVAVGMTPAAVAVDPSGSFVYVVNGGSNNVSAFTINSTTGALTTVPSSPFPAGSDPVAITFDNSGKFAYVQNSTSNNVSAFAINLSSGALTAVPGSPFQPAPYSVSGGGQPLTGYSSGGFAVDPNSDYAFFQDGFSLDVFTFTVDESTGALTEVAIQPEPNDAYGQVSSRSLQIDASGKFGCYVLTDMAEGILVCYTLDPTTGAFTLGAGGFNQDSQIGQFVFAK